MALTKTISKLDVKEDSGNKKVSVEMIILDDGVECSRKSFSLDFKKDGDVEEELKKMKQKIQDYADEVQENRQYFHHQKFDDGVIWLNGNVTIS